jgi:O-antigen/teichoic acid export membrane protein
VLPLALKRSLAWMGVSQGASLTLQFAASVVLARYLTPYEMGIYAVAAALVGVLGIVQALGLRSLIVRAEALTPELMATAFSINAVIAMFLSASIAAASFLGGAFLNDEGVKHVLLVLAVSPLLTIFEFLPGANIERRAKFKVMALIGTARAVVGAVVTIILAVMGLKYMSIALALLMSQITGAIFVNIVGREYVGFRLSLKGWRPIAQYGLQMLAVSGITSVSRRSTDIVLGKLLGLSALGIYNRASNLNGLLWENIHLVVGRVLFVDFSELHRQGASLRERYLQTVEVATAFLWPAFAGFALLSGPFIVGVYGEKWLPASAPLMLLSIASIILVSITMTWEVFVATGELRTQTRIEFIRAGVALLTFAAGCMVSLTAAAAARIVDALFAVFLYRPHLNRMTQTSFADLAPIYGRSAILTGFAIAPAGLLMAAFRMSPQVPPALALGSIAVGMMTWCLGLLWLKHPLLSEAKSLVRRFRNRPNGN